MLQDMILLDTYSGVKPLTTIGIKATKATKAEVTNIFDILLFKIKAKQIQDCTSRPYLRLFCT